MQSEKERHDFNVQLTELEQKLENKKDSVKVDKRSAPKSKLDVKKTTKTKRVGLSRRLDV